ncbi:class I SAM-dependent methyltransferase [Legionella pneumophila serogroup 1]|uniref:class I SAM-dependent methyltransferase n=1 Tax=Legionella pneumophila TaxID=446 RepID=UPI000770822D|nr:class I SAM-dependent methyltransferase [Legionella pneumophila]HAT8873267.1 methyltransferase domain-containing protein [Legionella pneumophila subsp. pneumophila]MCH9159294.1 class I SAM-dependent methyltransferase [Legionella pneumophila serogroup 1]CZG31722.1 bifunctional 3-demethylubiquinone-9 3-methyltransferase/ 2-octaprenyl-6-hydroxy phenol methylase [Legionella pneumophila]CZG32829.1 bifunctional 3-demethylubiquinone-9 3-methyltransferase/ 2-octaprenyl-6-hydroxy phenol methylase [Le
MPKRWNKAAKIRKEQIESQKDITFNQIFKPYYVNLINKYKPDSLLEIGCGTGHLSLELSPYVRILHAIEPSIDMFKIARQVLKNSDVLIFNKTIESYINSEIYDVIISHFCINSIYKIKQFIKSVKKHCKKNTLFIFTIPHPCFWEQYHPEWFSEYFYMNEQNVEVDLEISNDPNNVIKNIPYIHRPLSKYYSILRECGFHVSDFHEIYPSLDILKLYNNKWLNPRYCVFHTQLTA